MKGNRTSHNLSKGKIMADVKETNRFERRKNRIVERYGQREKELMDEFTRRIGQQHICCIPRSAWTAPAIQIGP